MAKKRRIQVGMLRIDPATFAALKEACDQTMLTQKATVTMALRAWLKDHHPAIHKKLTAELARLKKAD